MRLINNHQVILSLFTEVAFALYDFIQTAIAHKLGVALDAEKLESISPVLFQGWRINHQDIGVSSICFNKSLGNHRGYNGFTQTHHIGKEETIVLHQHLITLNHGIVLIADILHTLRHFHRKVILHLRTESIYQHLHVEFVWCRQLGKMSLRLHLLDIFQIQRNGLLPKLLKFLLAIFHIIIILHRHVQLIPVAGHGSHTGIG